MASVSALPQSALTYKPGRIDGVALVEAPSAEPGRAAACMAGQDPGAAAAGTHVPLQRMVLVDDLPAVGAAAGCARAQL